MLAKYGVTNKITLVTIGKVTKYMYAILVGLLLNITINRNIKF